MGLLAFGVVAWPVGHMGVLTVQATMFAAHKLAAWLGLGRWLPAQSQCVSSCLVLTPVPCCPRRSVSLGLAGLSLRWVLCWPPGSAEAGPASGIPSPAPPTAWVRASWAAAADRVAAASLLSAPIGPQPIWQLVGASVLHAYRWPAVLRPLTVTRLPHPPIGVWAHGDYCRINPKTGGIVMLGRR